MRWVPFTAHIRIVPDHGSGVLNSKKFENWRSMQRIAVDMYNALISNSSFNLAIPGGGQQTSRSQFNLGGNSWAAGGFAVKPQIGQAPAQVMITGFYDVDSSNAQIYQEQQIISGNEIYTGAAKASATHNPTTDAGVKALRNAIDAEFEAALNNVIYSIFRIEYSGVIYGDRGYHFPL